MPTEVVSTIAPSGGDYTSMSSWESAKQGDITSAGSDEIQIAEFETFSGGLTDNNAFVGWTCDATNYIILRAATSHQHDGTRGTGFFFDRTGGGAVTIRPVSGASHMRIEGLAQDGGAFGPYGNSGTDVTLDRCLVYDAANPSIRAVQDTIIKSCAVIGSSGDGFYTTDSGVSFQNCVSYGNGNRGFVIAASGCVGRNCASADNTGADFLAASGGTLEYCISEDTSATGTGSLASRTLADAADLPVGTGDWLIFQDLTAGSEDLHLVDDAENDAVGSGTTTGLPSFDVDNAAFDATTPSMGWDEIAAGGGGETILLPASDLALSTAAPTVSVTDHKAVDLGTANLTLNSEAPTVEVTTGTSHEIALPASNLLLDATAPTVAVSDHHDIALAASALALSSVAPSVEVTTGASHAIGLDAADLVLDAQAPTVTVSDHKAVDLPASNLALSAQAPTVVVSDHRAIALGASNLTLTGEAPTVAVNDNHTIALPASDLALDAQAPTVAVSDHHVIALGVADLALTSEAPTVSSAIVVASFDGISATFSLGDITGSAIGWTDVSTNDTPSYSAVATGDSNTWTDVDTSGESADWADVA